MRTMRVKRFTPQKKDLKIIMSDHVSPNLSASLLGPTPRSDSDGTRKGSSCTTFRTVLQKNITLLRRDMSALRREAFITIIYFGLLLVMNSQFRQAPQIVPGRIVNPPITVANLGSALSFDGDGKFVNLIAGGKDTVLVAPCSQNSVARVQLHLAAMAASLSRKTHFHINFNCTRNEHDIIQMAKDNNTAAKLLAAVVFDINTHNHDVADQLTRFTLHLDPALMPDASAKAHEAHNVTTSNGVPDERTMEWFDNGIITLQHAVQTAVIAEIDIPNKKISAAPISSSFEVNFRSAPFHSYTTTNDGGFSVRQIAPMYYIIILVITSQAWIKQVVEEKEKGLRDRLLVSGLSLSTVTLTWETTFLLKSLTYILVATIVGSILIMKTPFLITLVLIFLFTASIVALVLAVSTCFKTAKTAVAAYTFGAMIPGILANYLTSLPWSFKLAASFFSPMTFAFSFRDMFDADAYDQTGVHWGNIMSPVGNTETGLSVGTGMLMLLLDTIIYASLALYLGNIIPGNGSRTRTCCFCCWSKASPNSDAIEMSDNPTREPDIELANDGLTVGVSIKGLRKEFTSDDGSKIQAVNGLYLDMYDGQVTALLGHNGAGKTTTMSLLTGILDVSAGDAKVYGMSLSNDLENIRKCCGICTQHNLLWDKLTVLEHLELFGIIRGTPTRQLASSQAKELAEKVGLDDKLHAYASSLSGGMKRKLSVAIALIGNPKVIYLDEPTAGLDPESRHSLWNLISDMKVGRTVVLTTHHMDEADLLGDRIAIMSNGKLQVCGSSMYLKRRFGLGYHLNIEVNVAKEREIDTVRDSINAIVNKCVPAAISNQRNGCLLSYSLGMESQEAFPHLLDEIDSLQNGGSIKNYGLELPTLEEVFVRLSTVQDLHTRGSDVTTKPLSSKNFVAEGKQERETTQLLELPALSPYYHVPMCHQIKTMLRKRMLRAKRSPQITFYQIGMPIIQLCFIFIVKFVILGSIVNTEFSSIDATGNAQWAHDPYIQKKPIGVLAASDGGPGDSLIKLMPFNQNKDLFKLTPTTNTTSWGFANTMLEQENFVGGFNFESANQKSNCSVSITYNSTFSSSPPVLMGWLDTAILRSKTKNKNTMSFHPRIDVLPLPHAEVQRADIADIILGFVLSTFVASAFSFIPAIAITAIVEEKELNVLHQQLLSGANIKAYWGANFLFDLIFYIPVAIITVILIASLNIAGVSSEYITVVMVLILCFALHALPLAYVLSHLFSKSVTAQNMTRAFFTLTGVIFGIGGGFVSQLNIGSGTVGLFSLLFGILPNAALAQAVQRLAVMGFTCASYKRTIIEREGEDILPCPMDDPWSTNEKGVGAFIIEMLVMSVIFSVIVIWIEHKKLQPPKHRDIRTDGTTPIAQATPQDLDKDIAEERARALHPEQGGVSNVINIQHLHKIYSKGKESKPKIAVTDLCLTIRAGHCFGLLGPNGAGKTTTMSILTGTTWSTSGTAYVAGIGIEDDMPAIYRRLGFCPQFHGLFPKLTLEEHLVFYGNLKGMQGHALRSFITDLAVAMDMTKHLSKLSSQLSGGNKRKLSLAISLMGLPQVLVLDEPSAGIDASSRSNVMEVLKQVKAQPGANRCIVLTTHLLEEAEVLCDRVGIMVNGKLKAIGSLPHLKSRFGSFWQIFVSMHGGESQDLRELMRSLDENAELLECHLSSSLWKVPNTSGLKLAEAFRRMEAAKQRLGIHEYSISQCSLEQIFIQFAKDQFEEDTI